MYESLDAMNAQYPKVDVLEAIIKRHSVRQFKTDPVPREVLLALVDAARQAPSSWNLQPWEFIVVTDPAVKQALTGAVAGFNTEIVQNAGATIVCLGSMRQQDALADRLEKLWITPDTPPERVARSQANLNRMREDERFRREHVLHSTFIGIAQLVLAAMKFGLGTVWMGGYDGQKVKEVLGIPDDYAVASLIGVGWPANPDEVKPHQRRPLEEIYWFDRFTPRE